MQFAADHDLANCRFHGYVERDMFPALLQTAAIGLTCLAKGQEGLSVPSKAYALMAAGVPQIAVMARSAEIARVVVEEGCGLWVVPGDVDGLVTAIRQARASPALLRRMAELARRANCEKYSLEAAAAQYYDLLQPLWQEIESDADCRSPRQPLRSTFLRSGSAPVSPRQGVGAGSRTGR